MIKYTPINTDLFQKNRTNLANKLQKDSIAIICSNNQYSRNGDVLHKYRQNSSFFHLTGIEQEDSTLILTDNNEAFLFIIKPEPKMETWLGRKLRDKDAIEISGVKNIYYEEELPEFIKKLSSDKKNLYMDIDFEDEEEDIPSRDFIIYDELEDRLEKLNFVYLQPLLIENRAIKDQLELKLMNKAIEITHSAFNRMIKKVKNGVKEYQLEAELSYEMNMNGATHSFHPIVASGINSCTLHYETNADTCRNGELILFDFGAEYGNYAADISRTLPVSGKFSARQKECYQAVLDIQKETIKLIKPGTTVNIINKTVVDLFEKKMIELGLFTKEELINQDKEAPLYFNYYMHGASHLLGLDVHDIGFRNKDMELKPGMVITCEPGIYIKDEKIGIRIEDDILITKDGCENLTKDIPKEIHEIESLMIHV
jgi:Xaa-Pro aminopeptidase